jgi:F-type H+-transporting ATPase subunit epsilon
VATAFEVFLVTPERELWSGGATIVVVRGSEGEFAVMAGHQPMLSELAIGPLFIQTEGGERLAAAVDGGFIHVVSHGSDTRVDVLAEHAELESEIDLEKARALQADAERRIAADHDADALADLAKATTRLNLRG